MNKELIKKYKKEFDYWVNEGELLIGYKSKVGQIEWNTLIQDDWDYCLSKFTIVINDQYVEFRKALAEGKTIQYYDCVFQHELCVNLDKYDWIDLSIATSSFTFSDKLKYRIKPEEVIESIETKEPDIKIGDFVIRKDFNETYKCMNIKDDLVDLQAGTRQITIGIKHITHWQPQHGELCWFTDNPSDDSIATLGYFDELIKGNYYKDSRGYSWNYCEPFLNSKPSWFKD